MAKRHLTDLYIIGRLIELDDGRGDPVPLWIQKLNAVDHQEATRSASARRAVTLAVRSEPTSKTFLSLKSTAMDMSKDACVLFLAQDHVTQIREHVEAELADEEEWKKDDYLAGLQDAWDNGLATVHVTNPEDEEASRVFAEMTRFRDTVDKEVHRLLTERTEDLSTETVDQLRDQVIERLIDFQGNSDWVDEFYRMMIYLGVRDPDNQKDLYFTDRSQVDRLAPEVIFQLRDAFDNITVDPTAGKG